MITNRSLSPAQARAPADRIGSDLRAAAARAQRDSAGRSRAACRSCSRCEKRDEPNPTLLADGLRSQHHRGRR